MTKKTLLILMGITLSFMILTDLSWAETSNIPLENEYIRIVVNKGETDTGRFSVGTTGGDPDRDTDLNKPLIYGGEDPWTSYTTVRIGTENWVFGNPTGRRAGRTGQYGEMIQEPIKIDNTIQSAWQLGPIQVRQILSFARSTTSGLLDTARIEYEVKNSDTVEHNVGLRLMLDTMLGSYDGAPFRAKGNDIESDTLFAGSEIPESWLAFDSLVEPQVISRGTLSGPNVTTPDRVLFTNWGSVADSLWNIVDFEPGKRFMRKGEFELDSAIALFWDQEILKPGQSRNYVSHYGLGGVTITPGELYLMVDAPSEVAADAEGFQTFPIVAYVENAGLGEARNVKAEIKLPPGLKLVASPAQIELDNLQVGEQKGDGWQVRADAKIGEKLTFEVVATAENSEPTIDRKTITIVSPAELKAQIRSDQIALGIKNERYEPPFFEVQGVIKNIGGLTAENNRFELMIPFGLELIGRQNARKYTGPIAPGEEITISWFLRPKTDFVEGPLYYSLHTESQGTLSNHIYAPELKPKVWFGEPELLKDQIQVGDYFTLSLWATNVLNFAGAELDLSFDPELLEIVGKTLNVKQGTLFIDEDARMILEWKMPEIDNASGKIEGVRGERGPGNSLERSYGTLITIRFRAKKAGTAAVTVERLEVWEEIWDEYKAVECEVINGKILIQP